MALTAPRSQARTPSQRSERDALAAMIEKAAAADAHCTALAIASAHTVAPVLTADCAVEGAEGGIESAKANAAGYFIATATGNAGNPPRTIRQARNPLQHGEDPRLRPGDALRKKQVTPYFEPATLLAGARRPLGAVYAGHGVHTSCLYREKKPPGIPHEL